MEALRLYRQAAETEEPYALFNLPTFLKPAGYDSGSLSSKT